MAGGQVHVRNSGGYGLSYMIWKNIKTLPNIIIYNL